MELINKAWHSQIIKRFQDSKSNDELHFQDFPLEDEEIYSAKSQTHQFSDFPPTADSDDDESTDRTELLKEDKKSSAFWKFEYYQQFFDVDSKQVLNRVLGSMTPLPGRNYLVTHIRPNPDLYGPFWICMTLVFTTAIAGNLANYLQSAATQYQWEYDFHKVTIAATAIFSYWWLIPTALYGLLWWRGSQSSLNYSFLEIICVYGYSLAIYIPISILWVIQVNWIQWLLVTIGAVLSGSVLMIIFWPVVREDTKRVAMAVMALIFIFNLVLSAGFVLYFFHVPSITTNAATVSPASNHTAQVLQNINTRVDTSNQGAVNIENVNSATLSHAVSHPDQTKGGDQGGGSTAKDIGQKAAEGTQTNPLNSRPADENNVRNKQPVKSFQTSETNSQPVKRSKLKGQNGSQVGKSPSENSVPLNKP